MVQGTTVLPINKERGTGGSPPGVGALARPPAWRPHTLWTSAAPAMAYRLYADEWHLNHTVTTGIFAIYPVVVVLTLVGFGDISDHISRRATMAMGLGASLAGTLLFAVAPDVPWLFAVRALMGAGVGLTAGPSTAAVVEFATAGPAGNSSQRAALIASTDA